MKKESSSTQTHREHQHGRDFVACTPQRKGIVCRLTTQNPTTPPQKRRTHVRSVSSTSPGSGTRHAPLLACLGTGALDAVPWWPGPTHCCPLVLLSWQRGWGWQGGRGVSFRASWRRTRTPACNAWSQARTSGETLRPSLFSLNPLHSPPSQTLYEGEPPRARSRARDQPPPACSSDEAWASNLSTSLSSARRPFALSLGRRSPALSSRCCTPFGRRPLSNKGPCRMPSSQQPMVCRRLLRRPSRRMSHAYSRSRRGLRPSHRK